MHSVKRIQHAELDEVFEFFLFCYLIRTLLLYSTWNLLVIFCCAHCGLYWTHCSLRSLWRISSRTSGTLIHVYCQLSTIFQYFLSFYWFVFPTYPGSYKFSCSTVSVSIFLASNLRFFCNMYIFIPLSLKLTCWEVYFICSLKCYSCSQVFHFINA